MNLRLTDDELIAIGSFFDANTWGIPGVTDENAGPAIVRGLASLTVRELWDGEQMDKRLAEVGRFSSSRHILSSFLLSEDGLAEPGALRYRLVRGEDETWLVDARTVLGVHELEVFGKDDAALFLSNLARVVVSDSTGFESGRLAFLSMRGGSVAGLVFDECVRPIALRGNLVTSGEEICTIDNDEFRLSAIRELLS